MGIFPYLFCVLIVTTLITVIIGGIFMKGQRKEPLRNFRFRVEIDGIEHSGMCEVSGLETAIETVEYREGTDPDNVRYLAGMSSTGTLVLKRGITDSRELYEWFNACRNGNCQPRNIAVVATDSERNDKARWELVEAWPVRYKAPDFNARGNEVAMETIEIVYERLTRVL